MRFSDDDVRIIFFDQISPGRRWRLRADSQKTQPAFDQNRSGKIRRGNHNHRCENVRENFFENNSPVAETQCPGGFYEFFFAVTDELPAHYTCYFYPHCQTDGNENLPESFSDCQRNGDDQKQSRNRPNDIDEPHDEIVNFSSVITTDCADGNPDKKRNE